MIKSKPSEGGFVVLDRLTQKATFAFLSLLAVKNIIPKNCEQNTKKKFKLLAVIKVCYSFGFFKKYIKSDINEQPV